MTSYNYESKLCKNQKIKFIEPTEIKDFNVQRNIIKEAIIKSIPENKNITINFLEKWIEETVYNKISQEFGGIGIEFAKTIVNTEFEDSFNMWILLNFTR